VKKKNPQTRKGLGDKGKNCRKQPKKAIGWRSTLLGVETYLPFGDGGYWTNFSIVKSAERVGMIVARMPRGSNKIKGKKRGSPGIKENGRDAETPEGLGWPITGGRNGINTWKTPRRLEKILRGVGQVDA